MQLLLSRSKIEVQYMKSVTAISDTPLLEEDEQRILNAAQDPG